jgi:hypothetical protein
MQNEPPGKERSCNHPNCGFAAAEGYLAMRSILLRLSTLTVVCLLCGCETFKSPPKTPPDTGMSTEANRKMDPATRDNALALLDDLLGDEKNVSKILIIKHNSEELGKLIKNISEAAKNGAETVESAAKHEPGVNLKQLDLPPGELAARKAISDTKEHLLLHSKDAEFEFQLLLTQAEALNYGAHLAQVVAENESNALFARQFTNLSEQLKNLQEQVLAILRSGK